MRELKLGQVWRRYGSDLGDIDSWQVNQMGKGCCIVMNCATLGEVVVTKDSESSFTFDNELISSTPRWSEHLKG